MTLKETILFIKNVFSVHFREYVRHRPLAQLVRVFKGSGLVCFSLKLRFHGPRDRLYLPVSPWFLFFLSPSSCAYLLMYC